MVEESKEFEPVEEMKEVERSYFSRAFYPGNNTFLAPLIQLFGKDELVALRETSKQIKDVVDPTYWRERIKSDIGPSPDALIKPGDSWERTYKKHKKKMTILSFQVNPSIDELTNRFNSYPQYYFHKMVSVATFPTTQELGDFARKFPVYENLVIQRLLLLLSYSQFAKLLSINRTHFTKINPQLFNTGLDKNLLYAMENNDRFSRLLQTPADLISFMSIHRSPTKIEKKILQYVMSNTIHFSRLFPTESTLSRFIKKFPNDAMNFLQSVLNNKIHFDRLFPTESTLSCFIKKFPDYAMHFLQSVLNNDIYFTRLFPRAQSLFNFMQNSSANISFLVWKGTVDNKIHFRRLFYTTTELSIFIKKFPTYARSVMQCIFDNHDLFVYLFSHRTFLSFTKEFYDHGEDEHLIQHLLNNDACFKRIFGVYPRRLGDTFRETIHALRGTKERTRNKRLVKRLIEAVRAASDNPIWISNLRENIVSSEQRGDGWLYKIILKDIVQHDADFHLHIINFQEDWLKVKNKLPTWAKNIFRKKAIKNKTHIDSRLSPTSQDLKDQNQVTKASSPNVIEPKILPGAAGSLSNNQACLNEKKRVVKLHAKKSYWIMGLVGFLEVIIFSASFPVLLEVLGAPLDLVFALVLNSMAFVMSLLISSYLAIQSAKKTPRLTSMITFAVTALLTGIAVLCEFVFQGFSGVIIPFFIDAGLVELIGLGSGALAGIVMSVGYIVVDDYYLVRPMLSSAKPMQARALDAKEKEDSKLDKDLEKQPTYWSRLCGGMSSKKTQPHLPASSLSSAGIFNEHQRHDAIPTSAETFSDQNDSKFEA